MPTPSTAARTDPLTPEQRSNLMRRIRRRDTKPELTLRKELSRRGLRYRLDYRRAPGSPDIAMVGRKLAIFVDGEFWHGKKHSPERYAQISDQWRRKIERNQERDHSVNAQLTENGWIVIRVTDRAVLRDLHRVANYIERAAQGRFQGFRPPGIELRRP